MTTPTSSILLVFSASFVGSFGAVFLKMGAEHIHRNIISIFINWRLAVGILFFLLSSILYLKGIQKGELTLLYPMAALGYVWTLFWARLVFKEPLTKTKFIGLGIILLGIVFLALGNK